MWIARATYRLGAYLGTCTNDTLTVPDPVDHDKASVVLQKVQDMTPVVITACDRCGKAKKDFERLMVMSIVKIRTSLQYHHRLLSAIAI
ncbi:hypothetical protein DL93DRAFT_2085536 [Clavulina sp. PMI_390]|nr:hypothetical protein DL93DRAFT_2085536 [Clavulina sp. PMI_390]